MLFSIELRTLFSGSAIDEMVICEIEGVAFHIKGRRKLKTRMPWVVGHCENNDK